MSKRLRILIAASLVASCTGKIGDATHAGTTPPPPPANPMNPMNPGDPMTPPPRIPPFAPAPAALHRLTRAEYTASLRDLLGDVHIPDDLAVDTPLYGFTTVGASSLTVDPHTAEQMEAAALDVAAQVFADPARKTAFVGCAPQDVNDPCVRAFIGAFGKRAWRRPLSGEELDRWTNVAGSIAGSYRDVWIGLELTVAGMLESPNFLYRVELGAPDAAAGRLKYDGFEMASRLSYFLVGSTPDDALLDAAANGVLDTPEGIAREARRLLSGPRAHDAIGRFFDEHFKLDRLEGLTKDAGMFPQMSPTLGASMRGEIRRLIDDVVFVENSDLRDIFITKTTFVNDELARIYGMSGSGTGDFTRASHPANSARAGILTSAGFLALNAHETVTSPTRRGKFIRGSVLCQDIPPPPPGVNTNLPPADSSHGPQTLRQRLEALHYSNPTCAGCHLRMDPLGFALENFDAIGAYRTTDNGLPVDPRGDLDGQPFRSAAELAQLIRQNPQVGACLSRMAYRYATGHLETDGETATLVALAQAFEADGFRFQDLAVALVQSDGFRFAAVVP